MGGVQGKVIVLLAALALAVALIVVMTREEKPSKPFQARKLFESVEVGQPAQVKIGGGEDMIALRKLSGQEWGLESRGDYPVDGERVRRLVLSVLDMEVVDRLTSNPEEYEDLGVGARPENGRLRLLDEQGHTLADLYLGKAREAKGSWEGFELGQGQFVRVGGDPGVYVSKAALFPEKEPARWLKRDLLDFKAEDLNRVRIDHQEPTEAFAAARGDAEEPFELETPLPEGRKVRSGALGGVSRALENLRLEDVVEANAPSTEIIEYVATYWATTKEDLTYRVEAGRMGDKYYVRLKAAADQALEAAEHGDSDEESPSAGDAPSNGEGVQSFNARHGPWIYEVQRVAFDNLTRKLSDLVEDVKQE